MGNNKDTYSKSVKEKIPKFTLPAAMYGDEHPSQTKEPAYVMSKRENQLEVRRVKGELNT